MLDLYHQQYVSFPHLALRQQAGRVLPGSAEERGFGPRSGRLGAVVGSLL